MNMPWFGELPKRWNCVRAFALFDENIASNSNLETKTALQFRFGEIVKKAMQETDENLKKYTLVNVDDIMVNGLNLNYDFVTQRVAIVKEVGAMTSAYISLRPRSTVSPKYACYLLKTMDSQKLLNGMGTGIRLTLGYSEFKKTMLPLPPCDEQDKIVRFLDWKVSQINKLIKAKQRQIKLLQEQKSAEIENILSRISAQTIRIRYLGSLQNGISESEDFFTAGTPFVNYGDVYNNDVLPHNVNGLAKANEKQQKTYSVERGDIFFTRTSETIDEIGLTAVCDVTIPQAVFSGFIIRFRPHKNKLLNSYARYFFRSKRVRDYFTQEMNLVTRVSLGQTLLKNLSVLLPDIDMQSTISNQLDKKCDAIDKLSRKINDEIALFTEYRTKLISDVIVGKIDIRSITKLKSENVESFVGVDMPYGEYDRG